MNYRVELFSVCTALAITRFAVLRNIDNRMEDETVMFEVNNF